MSPESCLGSELSLSSAGAFRGSHAISSLRSMVIGKLPSDPILIFRRLPCFVRRNNSVPDFKRLRRCGDMVQMRASHPSSRLYFGVSGDAHPFCHLVWKTEAIFDNCLLHVHHIGMLCHIFLSSKL
jgi:hypothetical protein